MTSFSINRRNCRNGLQQDQAKKKTQFKNVIFKIDEMRLTPEHTENNAETFLCQLWWKDFSFIINKLCAPENSSNPESKSEIRLQLLDLFTDCVTNISSYRINRVCSVVNIDFMTNTMHHNWSSKGIHCCCVTMRLDCCEAVGLCIVSGLSEQFALLIMRRLCWPILRSLSWWGT